MSSYFDSLSNGGVNNPGYALYAISEILQRALRDAGEKKFDARFHVSLQKSVISFSDPKITSGGREKLYKVLKPALQAQADLGLLLEALMDPILDDLPQNPGCQFAYQVRQVEIWRQKALSPEVRGAEVLKVLEEYGNLVGRYFDQSRASADMEHPIKWGVVPLAFLPGVWVSLQPQPPRTYPTTQKGFDVKKHILPELKTVQGEIKDRRFTLVRVVETDQVWILFDFHPERERGKLL